LRPRAAPQGLLNLMASCAVHPFIHGAFMSKSIHVPAARGLVATICALALAGAAGFAVAADQAASAAADVKASDAARPADAKASDPTKSAVKPADGKSATALGGGTSDLPVLTRNELRTCLAQQDKLNGMQAEVLKQQAELDAEKAAIEADRAALKNELDVLDRTSASAVEVYNGKSADQDKRIDAYNQRGAPFNAKANEWKEQHATWDKDCANRRYKEDDLIVIKAGR
jgi:hypothetical protein